MSRLDSFIRRMQAQRDFLNAVAPTVRTRPGPILEIGLGNGRTYDHLRTLFPDREIFVFDRAVVAHPSCIPPPDHLLLGDARETLLLARGRLRGRAVLVHCDLGTGDQAANDANAAWLAPAIAALLAPGGRVIVNQALSVPGWTRLAEPPGVPAGRYFGYVAAPAMPAPRSAAPASATGAVPIAG
ncbi:MAG TPA: class I SAM-dependent methyltransferase [Casimicrobiaceae bacterium]|nr:class I SAM-dependent methyltransferase [Casimicrobiaceae bacterium]